MPDDLAAADRCVYCGLCLPHCPTYRLNLSEADSPRGRIALLKALGDGTIKADDRALNNHLDSCLQCRACERVCPSDVPFGRLMDAGHARRQRYHWSWMWVRIWTERRYWRQCTRILLWLYQVLGLSSLVRLCPAPWRHVVQLIPVLRRRNRIAHIGSEEKILLFRDCASEVFDPQTHDAVTQLVTALGVETVTARQQQCCGALAAHHGYNQDGARLIQKNLDAFASTDIPILGCGSACTAELCAYPDVLAQRVQDAGHYLLSHAGLQQLVFAPLSARAALHVPCTLRNVLRMETLGEQLLSLIPDLQVVPVADNHLCCGAAGSHMLTHYGQAHALLEAKLDSLESLGVDYLITHNIGCSLHWQRGIRQRQLNVQVMSPFVLMASQLRYDDKA